MEVPIDDGGRGTAPASRAAPIDSARRAVPDVVLALGLLAAGLKFCAGLEGSVDIWMADETFYLERGLRLLVDGPPPAESGPLYAAWYHLLSLLRPDPLDLYFFNLRTLTVLLPVALYAALRRHGISRLPSLLLAFWLLICGANLNTWPKVGHFALLLLLVAFSLARSPAAAWRVAAVCVIVLGASYARPELFLSFLLLAGTAVAVATPRLRDDPGRRGASIAAVALATAIAVTQLGSPLRPGAERDLIAFGQHFAFNWVQWTGSTNLGQNDWRAIVDENFGKVSSVGEALLANPARFGRHVLSNLWRTPRTMLDAFFYHANLFLPAPRQRLEAYALFGLAVAYLLWSRARWSARLRGRWWSGGLSGLLAASLALPLCLVVVVIYPRVHYLLVLGVVIAVWLASAVRAELQSEPWTVPRALAAVAVLVAMTPSAGDLVGNAPRANFETIRMARRLELQGEVNVFEDQGGLHLFLGQRFHRVDPDDKDVAFSTFFEQKRIGLIVLTPRFERIRRYAEDPTWHQFLAGLEDHGFVSVVVPGTDHLLLVDRRLLPADSPIGAPRAVTPAPMPQ